MSDKKRFRLPSTLFLRMLSCIAEEDAVLLHVIRKMLTAVQLRDETVQLRQRALAPRPLNE